MYTFVPLIFEIAGTRELSSAGSEHLPYKQRVIGSNPIAPTEVTEFILVTFIFRELSSAGSEHLPYKQRVIGSNPIAPTTKELTAQCDGV